MGGTGDGPGGFGKDVRRLFAQGSLTGLADSELLARFASGRDEWAFAAIVEKHGPMVLAVCRRGSGDIHAAEDAFQATFLALAMRARSIRSAEDLGGWLFRVARRISARAEVASVRRRLVETSATPVGAIGPDESIGPDEVAILLEEIDRLPDRYRLPVVLCHLEGLTAEAASQRLNCPVGTIWGRLSRARARLRARLTGRGVSLSAGMLGASRIATELGPVHVGARLIETTARMALMTTAPGARLAELGAVGTLAQAAALASFWTRVKVAAVAVLLVGVGAGVVGSVVVGQPRFEPAMRGEPTRSLALAGPPAKPSLPQPSPRIDADKIPPLPDGCDVFYKRLSPDRMRVAYVGSFSPDEGETQFGLFVVDLAANRVRRLIAKDLKTAPAWSPDSRKLAIGNSPGYGNIYPLAIVDVETGSVDSPGVQGVGPAWSPDGTQIAVTTEVHDAGSWFGGIPCDGRLALFDVATRKLTAITPPGFNRYDRKLSRWEMCGAINPVWSPDGAWIAFQLARMDRVKDKDTIPSEIWVVNRAGTEFRRVCEARTEYRWSDDGRSLIVQDRAQRGQADPPPRSFELASLKILGPEAYPKPSQEAEAHQAARKASSSFDPSPVFRRNRLWQNPPLDRPRSVEFVHKMEPSRLDERFSWRSDGSMLLDVIERADKEAKTEIGRRWVVTPRRERFTVRPGEPYPSEDRVNEAEAADLVRGHLIGTRLNLVAIDWGRNPGEFRIQDVRPGGTPGTIDVELVPVPGKAPNPRRYALNAGAMFETTSWAYLHDLRVGWSVLTIDAKSHRIVNEVDHGFDGKLLGRMSYSEWLDVDAEHAVPLRVEMEFPEHKFKVSDRFQWRPEGLWILERGESRFEVKEAQRETIADLVIDGPTDSIDRATREVRKPLDVLNARAIPSAQRSLPAFPFALGPVFPLEQDGPATSLAFTFHHNEKPGSHRWYETSLRALISLDAKQATPDAIRRLLLVLYDGEGQPIGFAEGEIPPGRDRMTFDFDPYHRLDRAHHWTLSLIEPGRARLLSPRAGENPALAVQSLPIERDRTMIVHVPATFSPPDYRRETPEGPPRLTEIHSIRYTGNAMGDISSASADVVSRESMIGPLVRLTAVLLDDRGVPIAAGMAKKDYRVMHGIHVEKEIALKFGGLDHFPPSSQAILGIAAEVVSVPGGSRWMMLIRNPPPFPLAVMLNSDEPAVWECGLVELERLADQGWRIAIRSSIDNHRLGSGGARRAIRPYRERLGVLVQKAPGRDPETIARFCRLAGLSRDVRLVPGLKPFLANADGRIRDSAAIALGLLGDASGMDRIRKLAGASVSDADSRWDQSAAAIRKREATLALEAIAEAHPEAPK